MGVVFSLWDFATRTPDQIIRVFYELYDQGSVRAKLWEIFRGFSVNDEKGLLGLTIEEKEVALLFDQLIDLVGLFKPCKIRKRRNAPFAGGATFCLPGRPDSRT